MEVLSPSHPVGLFVNAASDVHSENCLSRVVYPVLESRLVVDATCRGVMTEDDTHTHFASLCDGADEITITGIPVLQQYAMSILVETVDDADAVAYAKYFREWFQKRVWDTRFFGTFHNSAFVVSSNHMRDGQL